jgi:hypothetical protein
MCWRAGVDRGRPGADMPDIRGSGNAREFRRLFPSRRISCITGTAANLANHCLIPPHNIPSRSREFSGTGSLIAKRGRLERRAGGVPRTRRSAPAPPGSKNVANWQTHFFPDRKWPWDRGLRTKLSLPTVANSIGKLANSLAAFVGLVPPGPNFARASGGAPAVAGSSGNSG